MIQATEQKRIFLSPPHMSGEEYKYINEAFDTNWIAPLGPNVDAFEREIALYTGVKHAAAVSSGTAAIHLALILLEVKEGDTVFCSSLTFVASANPILYQGATPVFIDSEPETWNMSPEALGKALKEAADKGELPKAIIAVNLYGQMAKMDEIRALSEVYGVPIIEDAAESLGSLYNGKASGGFGKFGIFSFNGNKIITTSGGGMLVSDDEEAIKKAKFIASQARDQAIHYQHSILGFNYRMSNILAGIGRGQLQFLNKRVEARRSIHAYYQKYLSKIPGIDFLPEPENTFSNRWLTAVTIDEKVSGFTISEILKELAENNIEARPVWKPLHLQPLFKTCKYFCHEDHKSISEVLFSRGICLPSGSNLSVEELNRIIDCFYGVSQRKGKIII
ncbi:aminotransferase class I/II-fold pyridoxal phosphate-dependent enzyme [Metabacillus sp. GX 13764]|uniref:DegT/DnrJ/EryC1/StrS family aminotransferase n=1 Tax=Metabacillus kandeliae TaxID=2900151 RepID=UPI001E34CAA1|nr:aminotransferase class I/II-fold pyridoxal phosphate-dependent enzyme [Metabacillus kandeliae]MCD7033148.1 aminotransferase class I/II-fold pyridoxal phosphate-dependent enzyme [Metabacillus kandeliae]